MRRKNYYLILILLLFLFGIGYAVVESNLNINGSAKFRGSSFDVHFENITVSNGSVEINTTRGDNPATIEPTNKTRIDYTITLEKPGDFYEFTVKVINAGTIDAMINNVSSKLNGSEITTLPKYFIYNVSYIDDIEIDTNHFLEVNQIETYKVRVEYNNEIDPGDLPQSTQTYNLSFAVQYIQSNTNSIERPRNHYAYNSLLNANPSLSSLGTTYDNYNDVMEEHNHNYFLQHRVENDVVTKTKVGYVLNGKTYYLIAGNEEGLYEQNIQTITNSFKTIDCKYQKETFYDENATATPNSNFYFCYIPGLGAYVYENGTVYVDGHGGGCTVFTSGANACW